MLRLFITLLLLTQTLPAFAAQDPVKSDFQSLAAAIARSSAPEARDHLTPASHAMYDRFVSYGLMDCLPGDVSYLSSTMDGNVAVTKGSFRSPSGKMQIVTLAFVPDGNRWKLDLPETLRRAFGTKWESMVQMTEGIYLALRSQMGGNLTCEQVEKVTGS